MTMPTSTPTSWVGGASAVPTTPRLERILHDEVRGMSPDPARRDAYGGRVEENWQDQWMSIQASGAELKEQAWAVENLLGKIFDNFKEFSPGVK